MSNTSIITKISVGPTIIPPGFGLSLEQPAWDPTTARFYMSIPTIANNPTGCNYGQLDEAITCSGGIAVIDPSVPTAVIGAFDPAANIGVGPLNNCGPNGISLGIHGNLLEGCSPGNDPSYATSLVINGGTKNYAHVTNITANFGI